MTFYIEMKVFPLSHRHNTYICACVILTPNSSSVRAAPVSVATDWRIQVFVNGFSIEELGGRYCGGSCIFRVSLGGRCGVRWEGGVG